MFQVLRSRYGLIRAIGPRPLLRIIEMRHAHGRHDHPSHQHRVPNPTVLILVHVLLTRNRVDDMADALLPIVVLADDLANGRADGAVHVMAHVL